MSVCATILIIIVTILGPVTLIFMTVSFGTNHWLEFQVNTAGFSTVVRDRVNADPTFARYHLSRDRGLFRECYHGNTTQFIGKAKEIVDGNCFNVNYDQPSGNPTLNFITRLNLNRCFLAFFIISIAVFLMAYVFGLIVCCLRESTLAHIAGLFAFTSAFSLAAAIAFFHGAEYIERNRLNAGVGSNEEEFYPSWPLYLKAFTKVSYGWSYGLAWVGVILASLAATLYSLIGCFITGERYKDLNISEKHRVQDYPIAMEPVYAVGTGPHHTKHYGYPHAYLGPLAPEYYATNYPTLSYGDPQKDTWQWRESDN